MSTYTAVTPDDLQAMLDAVGVGSVAELFDQQIPAGVRLGRPLELPDGMPESEVCERLAELARPAL